MDGLTYRPRLFHSPFDRLRANGKILNLMAAEAREAAECRRRAITSMPCGRPYTCCEIDDGALVVIDFMPFPTPVITH
ncbi:MAG: hypothetical protein KJ725_14170 [Gammaproteobacteria bacterium]|nr:hypothetical protein [Gammaproteobacteria bacterium]